MSAMLVPHRRIGFGCWGGVLLLVVVGLAPMPALGQAPLYLVDDETTVSEISFRFVGTQTFEPSRLEERIATQAPTFLSGLKNRLAFLPGLEEQSFLFDPITLQKDVVRLRRFYQQNGFLQPQIDYPATQLDTSANETRVIFTIKEGPPVTIRDMQFLSSDGTTPFQTRLNEEMRQDWSAFRAQSDIHSGKRYTDFRRTQVRDTVETWLRNQGFAFPNVTSTAEVDSTDKTATLRVLIDPGPRSYVSDILIEGNKDVSEKVIRRELPFEVGDRFSASDVTAGQQRLFDLDLFRLALVDVPDQPRDSTVAVRYRVREKNLRAYSGQFGFGTQTGVTLEGSWRHRNFFGDARNFRVAGVAKTGFPANPPGFIPSFISSSATTEPIREFRLSTALREPYLFTESLSGSLEPFFEERLNPNLGSNTERLLGLNERRFGINTALTYNTPPFRSLSLQYSLGRVEQFKAPVLADTVLTTEGDLFSESVLSLSGTFGEADDFANPSRGYIFRPTIEFGGPSILSGVEFARIGGGVTGHLPLSEQVNLAARVFGGMLWPLGNSRATLTSTASDRSTRQFQDRFSEFLFYAGGGSDVRGWRPQLAGGKVLRRSDVARDDFVYRSIGGRSKLGINLEARLPFPGLGDSWGTAVFLDMAQLNNGPFNLTPPPDLSDTVAGPDGEPVATDPSRLMVGSGLGLRFQTSFGFLRVDLAAKLTPDDLDLRRPGDVGDKVEPDDPSVAPRPATAAPSRFIRRFRVHFGIGRSF